MHRKLIPWFASKKSKKAPVTTTAPSTLENVTKTPKEAGSGTHYETLETLTQPQSARFEEANPWTPEEQTVMYCMNDQDNVPVRVKQPNDFVYYISQSRSPGHKDQGQDCVSSAKHGNWEVNVLCDGHDKAGHMVSLGVSQQLPRILLRMINERNPSEMGGNEEISDSLMQAAFDEAARVVCWTKESITVGIWVKVFEGQWADKPGYIKESNGAGRVRVAIIDENGYHLPSIERSALRRPRYTGGCTCTALVRNTKTNVCKAAVSGDSRILVMPCENIDDPILQKQDGVKPGEQGVVTPAHNVYNEEEIDRLERDFHGMYEFDGNFLVNPITKFAIQPTRGFGDFDMFGTGYTHSPEITKSFVLPPGGMIFTASDGVFDTHVWQDEEIVSCLAMYSRDNVSTAMIVENMYRETLQRSLEGGYVDDISIYCFQLPKENPGVEKVPEKLRAEMDLPDKTKVKKKKDTADKRRTIGRGADSFTDLSAKVELLRKQREGAAKLKANEAEGQEDAEKLEDIVDEDHEVMTGLGNVMKNMALSHRVKSEVDPKKLLTGNAFDEFEIEDDEEDEEETKKNGDEE